ncbi:MAG: cytochrome b [Zoogloeaceae bacterium]|nr:cytochrome b [Zoogloeaceae bacterium]
MTDLNNGNPGTGPLPPYDGLAISLHWLSAVLVLGAIVLVESKAWFPKGSALRDAVKLWHFQIGAVVFLATLLRVLWLVVSRKPVPLPARSRRERYLGNVVHGLLYLLLLVLPLSGGMVLIAAGKPVNLLGMPLPVWADGGRDLARGIKTVHEFFGSLMIVLVALHVGAALWHHHVRRDRVLQGMLPGRQ